MRSMPKQAGTVAFVGAGPGDPGLLTLRAVELLGRADVVVSDTVPGPEISRHFKDDVSIVDLSAIAGQAAKARTVSERAKPITDAAKAGKTVVRLLAGDPFFDGEGADEAAACAKAKLLFEIVPGVPVAAAVPGYAGIAVADAKHREVRVADLGASSSPDWGSLAAGSQPVVLLGVEAFDTVADALVRHGRSSETPVAATRAGSTTEQHTVVSTLGSLAADAKTAGLLGPAVVVVGDVVKSRAALSWFETKALFG